jgi:hypothetical protein
MIVLCLCRCSSYVGASAEYTYTQQCRYCVEGEYCFSNVKTVCPEFSTSPAGSDNIDDCVCLDGYKPDAQHQCEPCVAGEFCANDVVVTCEAAIGPHMTSPLRAVSSSDCVCVGGFFWTGSVCESCATGSYKAGDNLLTSCTLCVAGKYSTIVAAVDESVCENCPVQSESVAGSSSLNDCLCARGSTGNDGGPCTFCAAGTFKDTLGSELCTDCKVLSNTQSSVRRRLLAVATLKPHTDSVYYSTVIGSISSTDCIPCPSSSRILADGVSGSSLAECECFEGYTLVNSTCVQCAPGTFKAAPGSAACISCEIGKFNTLYRSWQDSDCSSCPNNSTTLAPGATVLSDCVCNVGFYGIDALNCLACPAGSYSATPGSSECTLCPVGSYESNNVCVLCGFGFNTSVAGATSVVDCVCDIGFELDNTSSPAVCVQCSSGTAKNNLGNFSCQPCAIGEYQTQTQSAVCNMCPFGSNNTVSGATHLHLCICKNGFETVMVNSTDIVCSVCGFEFYSDTYTADVANVGLYEHKTCVRCGAGQFVQDNVCRDCGLHSGADVALSSAGLCLCEAGYTCTPHKYFITAISISETGIREFQVEKEETYANAGVLHTQRSISAHIELPLFVPVHLDWSGISSEAHVFFAAHGFLSDSNTMYNTWTGSASDPVVQVFDHARHLTTVVVKRDIMMFAVGDLTSFAGTPVKIMQCPCVPCAAGFYKSHTSNMCSCQTIINGTCVKCIENTMTQLSCQGCSAGQYSDSIQGSSSCLQCGPNQISAQASNSCTPCPLNSVNVTVDACACNAGYYHTNECVPCEANYYKSTVGNHACTKCSAPLVGVQTGQISIDSCLPCAENTYFAVNNNESECVACDPLGCLCPPGYTGDGKIECLPCAQGTWKSIEGSASCTLCPAGFIGHESNRMNQASACVQCDVNTYAQGQTCTSCVNGTAAPAGSDHVSDCIIQSGYTVFTVGIPISLIPALFEANQLSIRPCASGTFKNTNGSTPCLECAAGKYQTMPGQSACVNCPVNTVQISHANKSRLDSCLCDAGFKQVSPITTTDGGCEVCEAGKFSTTPGVVNCEGCARGQYFGNLGTGHNTSYCTSCPAESVSSANSTSISDCICNAGFERVSDVCHACNHNETEIGGICTQCPPNTQHSIIASSNVSNCVCRGGYKGENGGPCEVCGVNVWCSNGNEFNCPENKTTRGVGARPSVDFCYCTAGYYDLSGACELCPSNSFCDFNLVTLCPINAIALAGSTSISACQCRAGFKQFRNASNDFVSCVECSAQELCGGALFKHKIQVKHSLQNMPSIDAIKKVTAVLFNDTDNAITSLETKIISKIKSPSTRIVFGSYVLDSILQEDFFLQKITPSVNLLSANLQSVANMSIFFYNVAPIAATLSIRNVIAAENKLTVLPANDLEKWISVRTNSEQETPASPPTAVMRRLLGTVLVEYTPTRDITTNTVNSEPILSTDTTVLATYAAIAVVNVTAIVNALTEIGTTNAVVVLDKNLLETKINAELDIAYNSATMRRLLQSASASIDEMSLESTQDVTIQYDSEEELSSTDVQLIESETLDTLESTVDSDSSSSLSTEITTEVEMVSTDETAESTLLQTTQSDTTYTVQTEETVVASTSSASVLSCVVGAILVDNVCICDAGSYCSNLLAENSNGCIDDPMQTLTCELCPQNWYCVGNEAQACDINMVTLNTGASSATECLCAAGFTMHYDVCQPCGISGPEDLHEFYCPLNQVKQNCDNTLNLWNVEAPAQEASNCMCAAGYFRKNKYDTCKLCPKNHYCPSPQFNPDDANEYNNIYPCPVNMITHDVAQQSVSDCFCEVGFKVESEEVSTTCLACTLNQLCSSTSEQSIFLECSANTQPSPNHEFCICQPGYYTTSTANQIHSCAPCDTGKVSIDAGQSTCQACGPGTYADSASLPCVLCPENEEALEAENYACQCKAPYVRDAVGDCVWCELGNFFQSGHCELCPAHATAVMVAQDSGLDVCVCNAGYARASNPVTPEELCTVCPANTFEYDDACVSCGSNAVSNPASDEFSDCTCTSNALRLWNFFDDITHIPECLIAIIQANILECTACAAGKYSDEISSDPDSGCVFCEIGKYQDVSGQSSCEQCAPNKNTVTFGSSFAEACVCNAGYFLQTCESSLSSCPCVACTEGKYKNTQSNALCSNCAIGSYASSTAMTQCILCTDTSVGVGGKEYYNADTTFAVGKTLPTDCVCRVGYGTHGGNSAIVSPDIYDGIHCVLCKEGFYKADPGNDPCSQCDSNQYGSPFHPAVGDAHISKEQHCVTCPTRSETKMLQDEYFFWQDANLADDINDCFCIPGTTLLEDVEDNDIELGEPNAMCTPCAKYYVKTFQSDNAADADDCVVCNAGYYHNALGPQHSCIECILPEMDTDAQHRGKVWNDPSRTTDASYSGDITTVLWARTAEDCQCNLGYYKITDVDQIEKCAKCANGKYKNTLFSNDCNVCAQGTYSPNALGEHVTCTLCPAHSGTVVMNSPIDGVNLHDSIESCVCESGYGFDADTQVCQQCIPGKARLVALSVDNFPDLMLHNCWDGVTGKISRQECSPCTDCEDGYYQIYYQQFSCSRCPANAGTSVQPRDHKESCLCDDGYAGMDVNTQQIMQVNWDDENYLGDNDFTQIITNYEPLTCAECAVGYFSIIDFFTSLLHVRLFAQRICMQCPPHMSTITVRSVGGVHACRCNAGYEPNPAIGVSSPVLDCTPCPEGKFKETVSNTNCIACVYPVEQGSTHPLIGASSRDNCLCRASAGYVNDD